MKFKKIRWAHITLLAMFMIAGSFYGYFSLFNGEEQPINSQFLLIKELFWFLTGTLLIICFFKVKKIKAFFDWYAMDSEFLKY